jgi:CHASE3 domain sensor protein
VTAEPPRNDVLAERIDNLASRIGSMENRMDGLATEKTLIALIEGRDRVYNAQLKALQDDINDLVAAQASERAERIAADRENEERIARSRSIALAAIGITVTVVLGLAGLLLQLSGGAPA